MKIIIVGGVAGGMSAATRLRRLMEDAEITIFEKGPFVSFANCGLPYYVSGEIANRDSLLVQTPESLKARFNLDVRPFHEVIQISPEEHTVTVRHDGQEFTESYDKLILSPGAKPFIPAIEGLAEAKNAYTLRNVPDLDEIVAALDNHPKEAVVIGAGFIGLEMAENLAKRGLQVTIVEKAPHVLPPLDHEMAAFVQAELEFTYAPPFGSAKDPVNMLGYAALNLIEGLSDNIQWYQLEDELAKGKKFLDVRTSGEFQSGRLRVDTIHIPLNELRERLDELDKNQAYIVSCHSGLRSYIAERILKQAGFTVQNLDGAYSLYKMANPEGVEYGN